MISPIPVAVVSIAQTAWLAEYVVGGCGVTRSFAEKSCKSYSALYDSKPKIPAGWGCVPCSYLLITVVWIYMAIT